MRPDYGFTDLAAQSRRVSRTYTVVAAREVVAVGQLTEARGYSRWSGISAEMNACERRA